jgi:hypothetical protein
MAHDSGLFHALFHTSQIKNLSTRQCGSFFSLALIAASLKINIQT